jgi:hypothetical protein
MDSDSLRIARDRLSRVFRFLEALNQHRNPPKRQVREQLWTLWLKDLIDHPAIQRGQPRNSQENNTDTVTSLSAREEEFILKVARAKLTRPPKPPSELKFWLEVGWDDPTKELAVKKPKTNKTQKAKPSWFGSKMTPIAPRRSKRNASRWPPRTTRSLEESGCRFRSGRPSM